MPGPGGWRQKVCALPLCPHSRRSQGPAQPPGPRTPGKGRRAAAPRPPPALTGDQAALSRGARLTLSAPSDENPGRHLVRPAGAGGVGQGTGPVSAQRGGREAGAAHASRSRSSHRIPSSQPGAAFTPKDWAFWVFTGITRFLAELPLCPFIWQKGAFTLSIK